MKTIWLILLATILSAQTAVINVEFPLSASSDVDQYHLYPWIGSAIVDCPFTDGMTIDPATHTVDTIVTRGNEQFTFAYTGQAYVSALVQSEDINGNLSVGRLSNFVSIPDFISPEPPDSVRIFFIRID